MPAPAKANRDYLTGPGIATRSDKTARSYLAGVTFAAALIWIKSGFSNRP